MTHVVTNGKVTTFEAEFYNIFSEYESRHTGKSFSDFPDIRMRCNLSPFWRGASILQ